MDNKAAIVWFHRNSPVLAALAWVVSGLISAACCVFLWSALSGINIKPLWMTAWLYTLWAGLGVGLLADAARPRAETSTLVVLDTVVRDTPPVRFVLDAWRPGRAGELLPGWR